MRLLRLCSNKRWIIKDAEQIMVNIERILYLSMESDTPSDDGEFCISMYIHLDSGHKIEIVTITKDPHNEFATLSRMFSNK